MSQRTEATLTQYLVFANTVAEINASALAEIDYIIRTAGSLEGCRTAVADVEKKRVKKYDLALAATRAERSALDSRRYSDEDPD